MLDVENPKHDGIAFRQASGVRRLAGWVCEVGRKSNHDVQATLGMQTAAY